MSGAERTLVRLAGVVGLLSQIGLSACARNSAQSGFLPTPEEAQTSVRGGWVDLDVRSGGSVQHVSGELLAISADSLWVLSGATGYVISRRGATGNLTRYTPESAIVAGVTALGVLSTISNGLLLVITAPVWIITGASGASYDSYAARSPAGPDGSDASVAAVRDRELAGFSRFPQGMPRGMDGAYTRLPKEP